MKKLLFFAVLQLALLQRCTMEGEIPSPAQSANADAHHPGSISLRALVEGNPTNAAAYVLNSNTGDTIQTYALEAGANVVPIKKDPQAQYTLVIEKDGYKKVTQRLDAETTNGHMDFSLTPAFTQRVRYKIEDNMPSYHYFVVRLGSESVANVVVDWGDGTIDSLRLDENYPDYSDNYYGIHHDYNDTTPNVRHFISMTGDLDMITQFWTTYSPMDLYAINTDHLSMLSELHMFFNTPPWIDVRKNKKLNGLYGVGQSQGVLMAHENYISDFDMPSPSRVLAASVNRIIDNLYRNAVAHKTMNGFFDFSDGPYGEGEGMGAFPSPASLNKLRILRDNYGWTIYPVNF